MEHVKPIELGFRSKDAAAVISALVFTVRNAKSIEGARRKRELRPNEQRAIECSPKPPLRDWGINE